MSRTAFEKLDIYRDAERLAQIVWSIVRSWRPLERDTVGKQLIRAADSIGANIAEGFGRGNCPDHKRFIRIARGSVYEVKHWLRLAFIRSLVPEERVPELKEILDRLPRQLNSYLKAISRKRETTASTVHSPQSTIIG